MPHDSAFDGAARVAGARRHGRGAAAPGLLPFLFLLLTVGTVQAAELDPTTVEAMLNETAEELGASLAEEGKGYSYYTYGTKDLLYAVGDLDGDGRPEIVARAVYFMGVGSYDLVDVFADRGEGYERVDFLNLYNLGLEDEVASLEIREGLLRIGTVGLERGREIRRNGVFRWRGPEDVVPMPEGS